ncbi:hypothetical protein L596_013122 [Steinernema carpocapsae]|uniref:Uncharacterized protein n=1 Tax=Steinernema carpocapsae TaxID=34508 RepID=A0A4V6A501_STECR|nr:hypothetical protein L596_013122 [Steinernema carpocapsae]
MFRNNPRYVLPVVNTTTNLMLACTFCEEMMEVKSYSYSAGDININRAREFANQLTVELANAYKKQQDEYFPKHLKAYLDDYAKSTVNSIWNLDDAAKKICDYIKAKYSILKSNEYRNDNFVCIGYGNPGSVLQTAGTTIGPNTTIAKRRTRCS